MLTNCPNCGAPAKGYICEYCGTQLKEAPVKESILYADNEIIDFYSLREAQNSLLAYQAQVSQTNQLMNLQSQLQAYNASSLENLNARWQTNIYTYTTTNLDDEDDIDLEDSLTLPSDRHITAEEIRTYVGPIIFVVLIILGLILRSYLIGV